MAKTWKEKFDSKTTPQIKVLDKRFADIQEGERMFIATPKLIDAYINEIPKGVTVDLKTLRKDIAIAHQADSMCPVTASIYLRIVSEVAFQNHTNKAAEVTPFWRVVNPKSKLAEN